MPLLRLNAPYDAPRFLTRCERWRNTGRACSCLNAPYGAPCFLTAENGESEMAPVIVRARVLIARGDADSSADARVVPGAQTETVADMAVLGFEDEIARPDELYARYGAPDCDPAWRP